MKFYSPTLQDFSEKIPKSMVILLHGWGSHGQDLLPLAEIWQAHLPDTIFLSLEAHDICDQNPFGFQWFALGDWSDDVFRAGAEKARKPISDFLEMKISEYNLPPEKVILMGFSQGMMMALSVGLRQKKKIGGILGYSGALIDSESDLAETFSKPDICLIHGTADTVVPSDRHDEAVKWLQEHDYNVESLKIPGLSHSIEQLGLQKGLEFMSRLK